MTITTSCSNEFHRYVLYAYMKYFDHVGFGIVGSSRNIPKRFKHNHESVDDHIKANDACLQLAIPF